MQRSCARVASHVFETRGEVLSADAFASEIASLRESVLTDPSGAKRGALREAIAPLRRWLAEKNAESEARDDGVCVRGPSSGSSRRAGRRRVGV